MNETERMNIVNKIERSKWIYLIYAIGPMQNVFLEEWLKGELDAVYPGDFCEETDKLKIYPYAYTTSRKVVKKFMSTRRKDKFHITKTLVSNAFIDRDAIDEFVTSSAFMIIQDYRTVTRSEKNCHKSVTVNLTLTSFEADFLDNALEMLDQSFFDITNYVGVMLNVMDSLSKKNKKYFKIVGMDRFIQFLQSFEGDFYQVRIEIDELQYLLDYYGELFNY